MGKNKKMRTYYGKDVKQLHRHDTYITFVDIYIFIFKSSSDCNILVPFAPVRQVYVTGCSVRPSATC